MAVQLWPARSALENHPKMAQTIYSMNNLIGQPLTKRVDKSSPKLRVILMRGEPLPTAKFANLVNFGRGVKERYSVELSNVVIKSIESSFSDGDEPAVEVIQLGFNQAKWTYSDNDDSGKVEKHSEQFSTLTGK